MADPLLKYTDADATQALAEMHAAAVEAAELATPVGATT